MIFYDYKSGISQADSLKLLREAFPDSAPSEAMVYRWFREFKRGRQSLEDEERIGRPATAVTEESIAAAEAMVREDRRVTYVDIEAALQIGSAAAVDILKNHSRLRKVCCRWVPQSLTLDQKVVRVEWCHHVLERFDGRASKRVWDIIIGDETWLYQYDPETKQQSAVWVFDSEARPTKVKRARSVGRKMVAIFLWLQWSRGNSSAGGPTYCNVAVVHHSMPASSLRQDRGAATKDGTSRHPPPP